MIRNMKRGLPSLFKQGTEHLSGLEQTIMKNIDACQDLSKICRTSLGPNGMNKMVINHLGKLFVTSDAATIVRELEVSHPASNMLVMAAQMQEQEVGDGSNFVMTLGGEMLKKAGGLVNMGLHPSEIVAGYDLAGKKVLEVLEELVVHKVEKKEMFEVESVAKVIKAALAAKQFGEEDYLAPLVAKACISVLPQNVFNFNVDNIRVVKSLGGTLHESEVVKGMAFGYPPLGSVTDVKGAKVAVFTCSIDTSVTETKGTVLLNSADELLNYNSSEEESLHKIIKSLADSGVRVMVAGEGVGDMAKHFMNKYGILSLKISSKWQLRRLCRATGARPLVKLGPVEPEDVGFCKRVYMRELGLDKVTVFEQELKDDSSIATIILRGATTSVLNDIERAIDDGVNVVKAMGRDGRFLAGAGAVDIELAQRLQAFAEQHAGVEQYALQAMADSLEVVPRILAENSGMKPMDVISQLYAAHAKGSANVGVDIRNKKVDDAVKMGVYDHLGSKISAIKLAVDTVLTILRVDQIIMAKPAGGPKMPKNKGHWDDNE